MNQQVPCLKNPDARATIVGEQLTLIEWHPRLKPVALMPQSESAAYADVRYVGEPGEREVLVTHETPGAIDERIQSLFVSWAGRVGLKRVWFPDAIADIDARAATGDATVACSTCHTTITAGGFEFWEGVMRWGIFPNRCSSCGGVLAQWELKSEVLEEVGA